MWDFIKPVNLIRYLIVWRVNSSLVQLPRYLPTALSQVLGTLIANRLPTQQTRDWRKALEAWENVDKSPKKTIPNVAWPIESVLFAYPNKRAFGQGEPVLWELKLIGNSADHGIFLEHVLPAMEQAASTTDSRWHRPNGLWGRFDIQAVYASRGAQWEPVVSDGKLNLDYRATPRQWAEGLSFSAQPENDLHRLTWVTPCNLPETSGERRVTSDADSPRHASPDTRHPQDAPTLHDVLDALMERMTQFLPGKHPTVAEVWELVKPEEQIVLRLALQHTPLLSEHHQSLVSSPRDWPGRWIGTQTFADIPQCLIPYLELAAILHVGKQTHFGCGTFRLS